MDTKTGKRTSLQTSDERSARQLIEAKNQAECQPVPNLQIAKAYLAGADSGFNRRTWREALEALTATVRVISCLTFDISHLSWRLAAGIGSAVKGERAILPRVTKN